MTSIRAILTLTFIAFTMGCGPTEAIKHRLEARGDGLRFPHPLHIEQGLSCSDCHQLDPEGALYDVPDHGTCGACHDVEMENGAEVDLLETSWIRQEPKECSGCHPSTRIAQAEALASPPTYAIGPIHFSHTTHGAQACSTCHGDLGTSKSALSANLPSMATCVTCHAQAEAPNTCETCHPSLPAPFNEPSVNAQLSAPHPPGWERLHGASAQMESETCALCHQPDTCQSCHLTTPPQDHGSAAWASVTHGKMALFDRERCASCHVETSCQRCHQLAPTTHTSGFQDPLAALPGDPGLRLHSLLGKSQLRTCLTCHTTQDCTPCHAAGSTQ